MPIPQPAIPQEARRELIRRAAWSQRQEYLEVDYYRIRQKLFFPLPVEEFPEKLTAVRGLPDYPYATWLLWGLEERIFALGWAAEFGGQPSAQEAAQRDLAALTGWQRLRQNQAPDLCSAHLTRIITGSLSWRWVSPALRKRLRTTLHRLVEDGFPRVPPLSATSASALIRKDIRFQNISTIASLGLSLAATACRHPLAEKAEKRAKLMIQLWLEWGMRGQVEGVSYDGYTCDFLMDWLAVCSAPVRREIWQHPRLPQILDEIRLLGAPRRPDNLALIGDVEPYEMRFHYSFAAKYSALRKIPSGIPYPAAAEQFLRSNALPFLPPRAARKDVSSTSRFEDAHYALVLNGDTESRALRLVASWHNSSMGHMQPDAGSIVIGIGGHWLLSDPGYRQYMPTAERTFTLGAGAHNQPVINGLVSSTTLKSRDFEIHHSAEQTTLRLDVGQTYAEFPGTYVREIQMDRQGQVVVEDQFSGAVIRSLEYQWHGCPEGSWRMADGWAGILAGGHTIWFTCSGHPLQPTDLQRKKGSRGNLSIVKKLRFRKAQQELTVRWVFASGSKARALA